MTSSERVTGSAHIGFEVNCHGRRRDAGTGIQSDDMTGGDDDPGRDQGPRTAPKGYVLFHTVAILVVIISNHHHDIGVGFAV
jgi:hypothetical protein